MAYYIRKGLVEENIETLEILYDVARSGEPASFTAPSPKKMNSIRHHFRKMLAAAERLPREANGKFKDLRSRIEVSLDWDRMKVIVKAKESVPPLIPAVPNEDDMISVVKEYTGQSCQLNFAPSSTFNPKAFDARLKQMGYELARNPETGEYVSIVDDEELGTVLMLAEKVRRKPSSDLLKQFGFTRDDS